MADYRQLREMQSGFTDDFIGMSVAERECNRVSVIEYEGQISQTPPVSKMPRESRRHAAAI
jgi:hypothetical protein